MTKKAKEIKDTKENLESLMEALRERFGDGAVMKLSEAEKVKVEVVPSGSFSLDLALGVGGMPKGRIIEIFGPESSGKTSLALHTVAEIIFSFSSSILVNV